MKHHRLTISASRHESPKGVSLWIVGLSLAMFTSVHAAQIQDMVRIKGSEQSKLVGMGLVVGLPGTGDGGKFQTSMNTLAQALRHFVDDTALASQMSDAKNVAMVTVEATIPASGVREGDLVDVTISALAAKSLAGGTLFMTPLKGPLKFSPVFAFASGKLVIEDSDTPTVARIKGGAQMVRDVRAQFIKDGMMTLVIDSSVATWPIANSIAETINGHNDPEGLPIARAVDPKNVVVMVPPKKLSDPSDFITFILSIYMDQSAMELGTGARVKINERTKTIIASGDVEISPVVISHPGLTITTITPPPVPTLAEPTTSDAPFVSLDPGRRGGAKLRDLLAAFNQLKVEPEDRIAIIKEIHRAGKLHAQLIYE